MPTPDEWAAAYAYRDAVEAGRRRDRRQIIALAVWNAVGWGMVLLGYLTQ